MGALLRSWPEPRGADASIAVRTSGSPEAEGARRDIACLRRLRGGWGIGLVLLLALTVYVNTLSHQFVWDDVVMVVQNPVLRDLGNGIRFLREDFTSLTAGAIEGRYYRPTLAFSLALDVTLWGLDPAFFHLTNILLHAAVTLLVGRLALSLGAAREVAVLAALVFAIHPVHVEPVAWIAARQELLLSLGVLGGLLAYRRSDASPRGRGAWWLALGCQGLALLSKETSVVMPALLVASDRLLPQREADRSGWPLWRRALVRSWPFWGLAGALMLFRFSALTRLGGDPPRLLDLCQRVPGSLETLARYLGLLVLPLHMQPTYALTRPASLLQPWPALGLAALTLLLAFLVWSWRRSPLAAFAVLWLLITMSPVLDLVPVSAREMGLTDRYLYLPSVGTSLLLALGIAALLGPAARTAGRLRNAAGWAVLLCILVAYPWSLLRYSAVWRDDLHLYGRMVEAAPHSPSAQFNLGLASLRSNDLSRGTQALERAVRLDPSLPRPRTALALAYVMQGRRAEGFRLFDDLASSGAPERDYYVFRSTAHLHVGEWPEALSVAEAGARRFPDDPQPQLLRAQALEKVGSRAAAIGAYQAALRLRPDLFQAEERLGALLVAEGKPLEARQHLLRSLAIRPDRVSPLRTLALVAESSGDRGESLRLWRHILEIAPDAPTVQEAVQHLRRLQHDGTRPKPRGGAAPDQGDRDGTARGVPDPLCPLCRGQATGPGEVSSA